ncbi:Dynamin, GTPase domain [Penicillium roqueforti FM164]|uniref:Dynamin, GTPase domain n=2 Tax=Penicillium roqueforti TaxID=5082 RepID=W6QEV6_PENRF|nr:Dynamin, GTPase domain [Penicillium roqueforti FM164]
MSTPKLPGQGLGDPVLLDKIDRLLAYNLGEYVNLPQLVVAGDQSSGKSSVLKGLTKLPFPRDSGLCTQFATHIIFRRIKADKKRTVTASIVPAPDTDPEHASRLAAWQGANMESLDPNLSLKPWKRFTRPWVYRARKPTLSSPPSLKMSSGWRSVDPKKII